MNNAEFDKCMGLLKSSYGDSKYPEIRCEEIFKRVKPLAMEDFEVIVRGLIANEDRAPMMGAILEASSARLREAMTARYKSGPPCNNCSGEGIYTRGIYAYRCRCDAGGQYPAFRY